MPRLKRRLAFILIAIASALAIGTTGFTLIEGWSVFEAFYMSLTTITTVGYFEIRPLSKVGRIFNVFHILYGVSAMLLAIGAMTQTVIELELNRYFPKRRTKRMIDKLDQHFIVCGFGRVGRGAAEELYRAGVPFLVLERDEDKLERAMKARYLGVLGDATLDENLRLVGIDRAKGLIAALATDADNLFLIISAKALNPNLQISTRVLEDEAEIKLRRAGADVVLAPYQITGARLAQAILRPHVVQFLDFATMNLGLDVSIEQVRVGEHSEYVSKSLRQMQIRRDLGVIVLAIRQKGGTMLFNPDPEAEIQGGDYLIAMGHSDQLRRLETLLAEVRA
jgi:voltage-gated potassium channel